MKEAKEKHQNRLPRDCYPLWELLSLSPVNHKIFYKEQADQTFRKKKRAGEIGGEGRMQVDLPYEMSK